MENTASLSTKREIKMQGFLIAIEGGDGAGKTGAINTVKETMTDLGYDVLTTREPGGTPGGLALRSLVVDPNCPYDHITNTMIYAADRREHVEKVIRPAMNEGKCVITDRYLLSTLAYQGAGQGVDEAFILDLHKKTTDNLLPVYTMILSVDPRIALQRAAERDAKNGSKENRFEKFPIDFHDRMHKCMKSYSLSPSYIVDASKTPEEVHKDIEKALRYSFEKWE